MNQGFANVFFFGMFSQGFMWNALISGTMVALLAAGVGFFAILRDASFAAHALPKIGFAGAAGAVLLNVSPILGLVVFAVGGALGIGWLGKRDRHEVGTALLLVTALGIGALFLVLNDKYAAGAYALLFGQLVGVSSSETVYIVVLSVIALLVLLILFRPMLYVTILPDIAQARGLPTAGLSIFYLVIVGIATAVTVPVVGALLSFSMMIAPAATARALWRSPAAVAIGAMVEAVLIVWLSLSFAYTTGWPVGFFVATLAALFYALAKGYEAIWINRRIG